MSRLEAELCPNMELTIDYEGNQKYIALTQLVGGCYRTRMCRCGMPVCVGQIAEHFFNGKLKTFEYLFIASVQDMSQADLAVLSTRKTDSDLGAIPFMINFEDVCRANRKYLAHPAVRARPYVNVVPVFDELLLQISHQVTGTKAYSGSLRDDDTPLKEVLVKSAIDQYMAGLVPVYVRQLRPLVSDVVEAHLSSRVREQTPAACM